MANPENLIPNSERTPSQRRENARKAGKASAEARARKKSTRELVEMLDALPVQGASKEALKNIGIPEEAQTQQTLRVVALHKKALAGDPAANKLLIEIRGEAAAATINVEMGDEARAAYERAADAIKSKRG